MVTKHHIPTSETTSPTAPNIVSGFLRLPQVLELIPVSKSTWWSGVADGRFPAAVKLSPRTTAWKASDIYQLIENLSEAAEGHQQ